MSKIISAYRGMADYIAAARAKPDADRVGLWWQTVLEPTWNQWAAGEFNEARVHEQLSQPFSDLDGLQREIELLASSGIEDLVAEAYPRIAAKLPYHEEEPAICIFAADPADHGLVENLSGVVGACVGGNTLLTVNPTASEWRIMLPYVLAHERHHSSWGYHHFVLKGDVSPDLLSSLVNEGLADSFARQLFPQAQPIWIDALSPAEVARQWQEIRLFLDNPDPGGDLYRRFFFGDPALGTPVFTGYTLGFRIVQSYLTRHPEEEMVRWILKSPMEIFNDSDFR